MTDLNNETHGLRSWLERLNRAELPAMAVVVHDLLRLSQSETASVAQLTEVLMRDLRDETRTVVLVEDVEVDRAIKDREFSVSELGKRR